eukprot:TRINITY_DN729_c0_g1_i1.p1 TRINITY_DN729_c0_g1~~TRINITY_DN729_c0_g1_i1.p1  ORF type:complete len:107 (+),score=18.69 TRINITY_DN729_c0_g1_i1:343-663(+)
MLVCDVNTVDTLNHLTTWKKTFIDQSGTNSETNYPFILVANKTDKNARTITDSKARRWCRDNDISPSAIRWVSAKEDLNVDDAFATLGRMAYKRQLASLNESTEPT